MFENWELLIQFGAFGVVVFVVVYLLTQTIPVLVNSFTKALSEQRTEFLDALKEQRDITIASLSAHNTIIRDNTKALSELKTEIARGGKD